MRSKYHSHMHYYRAAILVIAVVFVVVIYCFHCDCSAGRHVYTKYHTQIYYYQQLIGCYVGSGEHIAMVMVVLGHICKQSIMAL